MTIVDGFDVDIERASHVECPDSPNRRVSQSPEPNDRAPIRLVASVVIEQTDEWLVGRRYLSNHSSDAIVNDDNEDNKREEARELTAT